MQIPGDDNHLDYRVNKAPWSWAVHILLNNTEQPFSDKLLSP